MEEQNETIAPKTPRARCKNCEKKLSKQGDFCPGCGQRNFDGRIRMYDLLAKFFANLTHLDNKFVKMCWQLFVPARVTIEYFQGKIKRYPHPVQFFFIVMFFFLLMFSKQMEGTGLNLMGGSISIGHNPSFQVKGKITVSKSTLYPALQRCMVAKEYRLAYDSLPAELRNDSARKALDSIHRKVSAPWEQATQILLNSLSDQDKAPNDLDTIELNLGGSPLRIATVDFVGLEPDSIIKKYGFKDWLDKVVVKQGIKSLKDQQDLINRCVGSLGWTILMLISVMALVLKLLYFKRSGYYVEHFIFLMHQQAGMYLFLTLALVVNEYIFILDWVWLIVLGWMLISPLIAMKRFYGQHWGWTIVKWSVYSSLYWVGLIMFFILTMLLVFAVF